MLILFRKAGERFLLGPHVAVTVLEVNGEVVKLACEAPSENFIDRAEFARQSEEPNCELSSPCKPESPFYAEFA